MPRGARLTMADDSYYVEVSEPVARACWQDFQHELDFPGSGIAVEFHALADQPARTRLDMHADDTARMDKAVRSFRLFLEGRGLIDSTTGLRR